MSDPTMAELTKLIPNKGDTIRIGNTTITMQGIYTYDGEEIIMQHWDVEIGDPEGLNGDTLNLQAKTEAEAREQALDNDLMRMNPTWVVKKTTAK